MINPQAMILEFWNNTNDRIFPPGIYLKRIHGEWQMLDDLTPEEIESIFDRLKRDDKAHRALLLLSKHFPGDKKQIVKQFITCNWGALDNKWDISKNKLQYERIHCPFKTSGKCPFKVKGIFCIKV